MGGAVVPADSGSKNTRPPAFDAIAGGLAGAISRVVVGPLDVVKIRMQVQLEPVARGAASKYTGVLQALRTIFREEGLRGLWRGTTPAVLLTVPYCSVQFMVLQRCKQRIRQSGLDKQKLAIAASFGSGAVAGAAATLASYPFDLLRTVLASQGHPPVYKGMGDAAAGIVKRRGVQGLYSGVGITLLEILPYAAVQFGTYDLLSTALEKRRADLGGEQLSPTARFLQQFCVGLLAGMAGKSLTHPLDVVKKRYQVSGLARPLTYGKRVESHMTSDLAKCVKMIYKAEGLRGFLKGLSPSLIKAAPASAVTFACYEFFVGWLEAQSCQ